MTCLPLLPAKEKNVREEKKRGEEKKRKKN